MLPGWYTNSIIGNVKITWDTGAHPGPEQVYMAKVSSPTTTDLGSLNWFKIYESGLLPGNKWASDIVNADGGNYSVKIPSDLAPGYYLLRPETIGLHVAETVGQAQFYM
jgi:Auxiliary Activity family 9 (formerly GH61)